MWQIEFTSARFSPYLPEQCQGNPGVYGFELAYWLSVELMKRKVVTSYPMGGDWGWLIEFVDGDVEITIGCSSQAEEGDGYNGKPILWGVFIRPAGGGFFKRSNRAAVDTAVRVLAEHIGAVLEDAGIKVTRVAS